jgi:hypothetical protein
MPLIPVPEPINSVVVSPDGKYFALGTASGLVQYVNLKTGQCVETFSTKKPHRNHRSIDALAFSPNGIYVASGGADHTVRIWPLIDIRLLHSVALALLQAGVAPYVVLDIVDFLLATTTGTCSSFSEATEHLHLFKITAITRLQQRIKLV